MPAILSNFGSVHKDTMVDQAAEHGLTFSELEEIEESAHRSQMTEPKTVLRLAAALREALQAKENACAIAAELRKLLTRSNQSNRRTLRR